MKIEFDDGSYMAFEPSTTQDELLTISMCGLTQGGKKAVMSASVLSPDDVARIIEFLAQWKKSIAG